MITIKSRKSATFKPFKPFKSFNTWINSREVAGAVSHSRMPSAGIQANFDWTPDKSIRG